MNLETFVNAMGVNVIKAIDKIQCVRTGKEPIFDPDELLNKTWINANFKTATSIQDNNSVRDNTTGDMNNSYPIFFSTNGAEQQIWEESSTCRPHYENGESLSIQSRVWRKPNNSGLCKTDYFLSRKVNTYDDAIEIVKRKRNEVIVRQNVFNDLEDEFELIDLTGEDVIHFLQPLFLNFYKNCDKCHLAV